MPTRREFANAIRELSMDAVQKANSGHPERDLHRGIEATTGPLGQGFANGVGMALAERSLKGRGPSGSGMRNLRPTRPNSPPWRPNWSGAWQEFYLVASAHRRRRQSCSSILDSRPNM